MSNHKHKHRAQHRAAAFTVLNTTSMIPINELRYGSWVTVGVNGLRPAQIAQVERWGIDNDAIIVQFLGKHPCGEFLDDIEPIPLTPEILEKCGFQKSSFNGVWVLTVDNPGHPFEYVSWDCVGTLKVEMEKESDQTTYQFGPSISKLHMLQMHYFMLTGKELDYTP